MKNFNFKIPERKFHHNELPTFVIDETNKTLFFSFLMLSFGILFSIKTMNIHIVLITLGLVVMYAAAFFYFFYRHFIYDNLLIYDGYVTYYDDEDSSARNRIKIHYDDPYECLAHTIREQIENHNPNSIDTEYYLKNI